MNKKILARASVALSTMLASVGAMANTTGTVDPTFQNFRDTVVGWAKGPLGTGLAITMMLMGAGMGVAKNSPMPALSGVAGAAFLNWGPGIITQLTEGALI
ncbi:DNA polymerase V subunit UmuC [Novimethylophilus kurashikiensis]|uniref:DNA polymerase V subunit UmuC n=1 Tax=Novimethylophilus kurashikiensis TaxID=1825523 RepID=A0A2R5F884_9PROT|nr:TraA family conjugative transfer protein [Novimethylophilus kurashikiensis]GBG14407.1 DNA polymerase V subunit UmuC [Novimethylophilus kurashikiensis]